ncbi:MAG: peptidoglycan-binding protein [bacterium]
MIRNCFRILLTVYLLCVGCFFSQGAYAGAWADYNAKIEPLFHAENQRLDRIHHSESQIELGFTVEVKQSGEVREVKIITSSGSDQLDAVAVKSAFDLSPLPTPPASVFFRQFFTPLTFRFQFNPRKVADQKAPNRLLERKSNANKKDSSDSSGQSKPATRPKRSDLVASLQTELTRIGFDPGPVDGYFGNRTKAAIIGFQRQGGLPADGRPSRKLLQQLNDYQNTQTRAGSKSRDSETQVSANSTASPISETNKATNSDRFYEDYEYIDPSAPKVYEDYEFIDQ